MKYRFFRGKNMKFLHRIQQGILAVCLGVLLGGSFAESREKATLVHNGTYRVIQMAEGGVWEKGRDSLTAAVLKTHLSTLGINSFKELGRLILAQGVYVSNGISYDHDNLDNSGPNYINRQRAGSLYKTPTLSDLKNHLFDHGHLGWYSNALAIKNQDYGAIVGVNPQVAPRGIFNIDSTIRGRILPRIQDWVQNLWDLLEVRDGNNIILRGASLGEVKGYNIDPPSRGDTTLRKAAINLITCLFSSNTFDDIQIGLVSDERFTIDARYHGVPIQGISYTGLAPLTQENCLGFHEDGTPTNKIRLVVGVYNGTIYIASLFPEG